MSLGLGTSLSKGGLATPSIVTDSLVLKHNYAAGGVVPVSDGSAFFDGTDDYITIADDSTLDITGNFSITMWAKFDTFPSSDSGEAILQKGDQGSNRAYGLAIYNTSGNTTTQILLSTNGSSWFNSLKGGTNLSVATWYHISGTYDGTTVKLYLDGVLDSSEGETDDIEANSSALVLGYNGSAGYMGGNICNVGIWSTALTQAQIKSIMWKNYAGLDSTETTNLVSWWNLSANANDDHGSNNGTLS